MKIEDVNMFQLGYNKAIDDLNLIHGKLIVRRIHGGHKMSGKQTNADRIRNMSDEELAEYLPCPHMVNWKKGNYDTCVHPNGKDGCKKCILNWLQSEAE